MRKWLYIVPAFVLAMTVCFHAAALANPSAEKDALAAAQTWLAMIDSGRYADSWNEAARYFRDAVPKEQWVSQLGAVRKPLGRMLGRKVKSAQYTKTLPGAPDGEYVVIQYETSFENKKSALETITPMRDRDGRMRVSGYYIR